MSTPRRARPVEQFPRPFEVEPRSDYLARVTNDRRIKAEYTPAAARLAAEREWAAAKARSLVSITAHGDQFLVFGELDRG